MGNNNPLLATLASNIKHGIEGAIKDIHTSTPGIIESFDPITQLATIQPAIKRMFISKEEDTEVLIPSDLPLLINVPVIYPRGGGFSITFPVKKGDECLLVFCERCIDGWHETGKVKNPSARRFHSLSDATAFVGISSVPNKIPNYDPDNIVIKKDDDSVYIKLKVNSDLEIFANANMDINVTGDISATCANITVDASSTAVVTCPESTFNGNVTVNGNITFTGVLSGPTANLTNVSSTNIASSSSLSVGGKEMSGHTHPQGTDSNGDSQQNTGGPL